MDVASSRSPLAEIRVTVDVVMFTADQEQLKVLLIERQEEPFNGHLIIPGGFVWEGETSLQAAQRILHDKTGVTGGFMEQLYTFDALDRDPRGRIISVTYMALVPFEQLHPSNTEYKAALHPIADATGLGFDHDTIVEYADRRLRSKLSYTNVAYSMLPPQFTFRQLQQLYEVVLGVPLDKRNFRKKFLSLDLIEPTNERVAGGRHRPAQLYRFKQTVPMELPSPAWT